MRYGMAMALTMALAVSAWLPLAARAAPPADTAELEQRLAARLAGDRSGACVQAAVLDAGRLLRAALCAGTRSDGPPAADAAFEIGSVTKTMTAFLVADLVARGAWSLDDPIARHLPAGTVVPRQGERQILVRDLLTHSSGLPALPPGLASADAADPYAGLTEPQLLAALVQVKLARPIGSQAEYSNFGMMLVSAAVARSSGGNYEAALQSRLFDPLGMDGAYVGTPRRSRPATGHLPGGQRAAAWAITPNLAGIGMVKASLADMVRYARASLGDGPPEVVSRLQRTHEPLAHGFAMNWMLRVMQGRTLLMHEGGSGGFSSALLLDPAARRAVIVLADTALTELGGLGDLGLSLLGLEVPVQPPRRITPAPAALRKALAGEYELAGLRMKIWEAPDGRLLAQATGQSAFELFHDSRGDFFPSVVPALLSPLPQQAQEAPGQPLERFAWRQGGGVVVASRVGLVEEPPAISNPAWRDWAGEFQLAPAFALRVFERAGRLMVQGTGQPAIAAEPTGPDRIEIREVGAVVEFERDAAGRVVAAALRQGGQTLRGPRR